MKKILIATAVASALVSGLATAGATLYGKAHVSIDKADNGANYSETSVNSNSSRVGIKGFETLGTGYAVGYQMEWGVDMDGTNSLYSRNTGVWLGKETVGSVLIGRWDTPMKSLGRKTDMFKDQVGDLRNVVELDDRWNNVIRYKSPTFASTKATVMYSTDTTASSADDNDYDGYSLNVVYDNGPAFLGAAYDQKNTMSNASYANRKSWRLAGGYQFFNALDINASYTDLDNVKNHNGLNTNVMTLGTSYKFGNNKVKLQYSERDDYDTIADSGSNMLSIGVDHNLSKRTQTYMAYSITDNDQNANTVPWQAGHGNSANGSFGDNADVFSVGIVHSF